MRKTVTLCGSLRFFDKIAELAERLILENGWVVLTPVPHIAHAPLTDDEKQILGEIHRAKIDLSDAIFVVNVNGYIGDAVKSEIAYAQNSGKEIFYLEEPQ